MRRLAARAHLWGGLLTAPFLLVLGLSGTALVLGPSVESTVADAPAVTSVPTSMPSFDAIIATVLLAQPGAEPRALWLPTRPDRPFVVETTAGGRRLDVAVDAATLRIVDARAPERSLLAAVRSLHGALHGGRAGALVVGLLGLGLAVESASGLWLYGPSLTRRVRGGSRRVHRVVGAGALAVGALVGVTGALLALSALAASAAPVTPRGILSRLDVVSARVPPSARIVAFVAERGSRVRVDLRAPDGERRSVLVDSNDGTLLATIPVVPDRWELVRRLHAGDFAGWASRALYAGAGLALAVLSVTGVLLFMRRGAMRSHVDSGHSS